MEEELKTLTSKLEKTEDSINETAEFERAFGLPYIGFDFYGAWSKEEIEKLMEEKFEEEEY